MSQNDTGRIVLDGFLAGDAEIVVGYLTPDATFHSPVADYNGSEEIARILAALAQVLRGLEPVSVHSTEAETICFFTAAVAGRRGDGVLWIVADRDEPVTELTLMIRPLETLIAGVKAMERVLRPNPA